MASGGDSNPPSGGNYAVSNVRNIRLVDSRHAVDVRPPADPGENSGPSRMLVYEGCFQTGLECSVDTELLDGIPRRFVQTNLGPFVYVDHVDELIVAPHVDVGFHPNDHQIQKIVDNKYSRESIQEALDECLVNFEWPLKKVNEQKMSSFKLVIEQRLSGLLKAVLDMISDFSKHGQLFQLLRQAFTKFGALLQSLNLGSLTFHFQYTDQATALRMIESEEEQGKLIGLLHQFLPDWIRMYARWEVQHYSSTEHRPSFTYEAERVMVWRIPLTPHSSHTRRPNKDTVDAEALTQIIEPMINRSTKQILSTLGTTLASLQETIIDHIQRAVPTPQSVKDVSSSESQYPGPDSKDPAVLMEPEMSSSLQSPPLDTTKPGIGHPESEETVSTQETPDEDGNIRVASIVSKEPQEAEASPQDVMATTTQDCPESIWIPFIRDMYPKLLTKTYFFPPINFRHAPLSMETIAGQTVSVRGDRRIGMPRKPRAKSSARRPPLPTPPSQVAGTLFVANPPDLQSVQFQEYDPKAEKNKEQCLRALSDIPGQVMMVISGLQLRKYLDDRKSPLHAATIAKLPTARHLSILSRMADDECDILIIHSQFGLVVGKISSIHPEMFPFSFFEETIHPIAENLERAFQQLQNQEMVLRHLVCDLPPIRITKTILLPNITSHHLHWALSSSAQLNKEFCELTNSTSLSEIISKCLCEDNMDQSITWWSSLMGKEPDPSMTDDLYQRLVARFCGPATTVEVPIAGRSSKVLRTMGQAVAEIGENFSYLALTPTQVDLLKQAVQARFMYLQGPPGTGKSTVLLFKGLQRARQGAQVAIVGGDDTQANTMLMEAQLLKMVEPEAASRIQTHFCDFSGADFNVKASVSELRQQLGSGPALIILSEVRFSYQFISWTKELRLQLPRVSMWASGRWTAVPVLGWLEIRTLQEPLRRPPELVREMKKTMAIHSTALVPYIPPDFPVATQGIPVRRLQHQGQPGHSDDGHSLHCAACADAIADLLIPELRVGDPVHRLQYRDTWILCGVNPHADDTMIQRLQQHHKLPVGVVSSDPLTKADARELALASEDRVMVTHYKHVRGLERRVVIGLGLRKNPFPAMSTSTSFYCSVD